MEAAIWLVIVVIVVGLLAVTFYAAKRAMDIPPYVAWGRAMLDRRAKSDPSLRRPSRSDDEEGTSPPSS